MENKVARWQASSL